MNLEEELKEAKERLKKARKKIDEKAKGSEAEEPDTLVSGNFDELTIRRREKKGDEDE